MARSLLALGLVALLAACGSAPDNASDDAAPVANLTPPAPGNSAALGDRPALLERCRARAAILAPPGTDIEALCDCTVDRVIAGAERMDAARQCAAELGVTRPAAGNQSGEARRPR